MFSFSLCTQTSQYKFASILSQCAVLSFLFTADGSKNDFRCIVQFIRIYISSIILSFMRPNLLFPEVTLRGLQKWLEFRLKNFPWIKKLLKSLFLVSAHIFLKFWIRTHRKLRIYIFSQTYTHQFCFIQYTSKLIFAFICWWE